MTEQAVRPPAAPEDRGGLRIDPVVVRKVAQRAADETPGTTAVQRKLAGLGIGSQGSTATVTGDGDHVELRIDLALHYPAAVREVVADVRARVTEAVERITAYRVRGVDVTVSALRPEIRPRVE
ncbi:Asp23/Gls24 family envelope stress response protein [Actinokineospora sp.]|uniref:Asp23/Gls24 family envelope stress response protein n=1 Tax=Actinokineospora sp. TaxID=1872133 RepID=UPI0040375F3E